MPQTWHRGWSSLFSFFFSEEEYDEEEEEYEEEVQTNPDEYEIFFLCPQPVSEIQGEFFYWSRPKSSKYGTGPTQ